MKTSQCQARGQLKRIALRPQSKIDKAMEHTRIEERSKREGWSGAVSTLQRLLLSILILCPTTAAGIQFCLLCCQPEPMPRSLTARAPLSTQRRPCRPAAWLGKTIHMVSRAFKIPLPSITPDQCYRQCPSEEAMCRSMPFASKWFHLPMDIFKA